MKKTNKKARIGGFILGAVIFLTICLITLGGRDIFSEQESYVLYFDGSVNGLSLGAAVVFRGVPLGKVTQIQLVANPRSEEVTIPVHISINANSMVMHGDAEEVSEKSRALLIQRMIQRGLRARLHMRSFVTGQYEVELDFFPATPARYHSADHSLEIPTIPSTFDEIQRTFANLPLESMSRSLSAALDGLAKLTTSQDLHDAIKSLSLTLNNAAELTSGAKALRDDLQRTINSLGDTSATLDQQLPQAIAAFQLTMASFSAVANELKQTVSATNKIISPNSKTLQELHLTLDEIAKMARSFRELANLLEQKPESLLRGKGGR